MNKATFGKRVSEGMAAARQRGKHVGRPRMDSAVRRNKLRDVIDGRITAKEAADELGVEFMTIYQWARRYKAFDERAANAV